MLGTSGPVVSFSFDDFPRSAYTVGGCILEGLGVRGTYYVAMGLINTTNRLGEQFRLEDLVSAAEKGHELASHTFSHLSSRQTSLANFQAEVRKGCDVLKQVANIRSTSNFAYPYGDITFAAKQAIGRQMMSCRGTCGGVNGPLLDLNLLRANSLYGDHNRLDAVRRLIARNEERKGWLIFYTHDVQPRPSIYGCTPKFLESAVRLAVSGSAKVLPVAEVIAMVNEETRRVSKGQPSKITVQ